MTPLLASFRFPGNSRTGTYFFGMYEDSLPANYLSDTVFMNALGDFDEAWRKAKV
jgi:hypothetical protein